MTAYLALAAFTLALICVAAIVILVRFAGRDEYDFEIDETLLEADLRHELQDISFGRQGG